MKRYNDLLEDVIVEYYKRAIKKNLKHEKIILAGFIGIIIILFCIFHFNCKSQKHTPIQEQTILSEKSIEQHIGEAILYPAIEINDSILYNYLLEIGAWYPDILIAQAKIESASYTSNVFKKANNLYGMKSVYSRFHCQTGAYNNYGCYDSWKLSALDRVLWDLFIFDSIKPQREEYLRALRNYAEAQNYITTIQKTINSLNYGSESIERED